MTGFVPPSTVHTGLASFVLRGFEPQAWKSSAEARWLVPESFGDHAVTPGAVVVVTEGPRIVGYFHVEEVLTAP